MESWFYIRALACAALIIGAPVSRADAPVTAFAAASLKTALDQVASDWPQKVTISYSGSGTIARQIAQGAPADMVILANPDWMDWLQDQGIVDKAARVDLLGNSLVLIAAPGHAPIDAAQPGAILTALDGGRLAIGHTKSVPAGIYGRAWLENTGLWDTLAPHLAEADNVRAALAFVARGEAPLGLVYASDAYAEPRVDVVYHVPTDLHPEIIYPAAALTPAGKAFLNFLTSPDALQAFEDHGFLPTVPPP